MANEIFVGTAISLYQSLPAATLFRGLTGYGLVLDSGDQEVIGEVSSAKGIWKPMYFCITGGETRGRKKLTVDNVKSAVEQFQSNPLWAVLRSTTGYGLKLDSAGMAKLVEASQASAPVTFEISHYGGRSIVLELAVQLGKVIAADVDWKSGFGYQNIRHRAPDFGQPLVLSRFLENPETSSENLEQIWQSITSEASRLGFMNTDGTLPRISQRSNDRMRVFLQQELTSLVSGTQIDEQPGFNYNVRRDNVIEIQKRLSRFDTSSEANFETTFEAFRKECARVMMLYCQPLSDSQRQKAGKPTEELHGLPDVQWLEWQEGRRGGVIAFHPSAPRRQDATFPAEGWNPKAGERNRCLCIRKGRGFTAYPAPYVHIERFVQKDEKTAGKQVVRVAFNGAEKVMDEADLPLKEWEEQEEGTRFVPRLENMVSDRWIIETITGYVRKFREQVVDRYEKDLNGKPVTEISRRQIEAIPCPAERRFRPEKVWIIPADSYASTRNVKLSNRNWKIMASGINPDGEEIKVEGKGVSWNDLPKDLRQDFLSRWPICKCRRERYQKGVENECVRCQSYRLCERCGKETRLGKEEILKGEKLYCADCGWWFQALAYANQIFPQELQDQLVQTAKELLGGKIVEGEQANKLAQDIISRRFEEMLTEHKLQCLRRDVGGNQYSIIIKDDGYWASKFSAGLLKRIANLPQQGMESKLFTLLLVHANQEERELILAAEETKEFPRRIKWKEFLGRLSHLNLKKALRVFVAEPDSVEEEAVKAVEAAKDALSDFRSRVGYSFPGSGDERARKVEKAEEQLKSKVFSEAKKLAEEAQAAISEAVTMMENGCLFYFQAYHRRGGVTGNSDGWVVRSDGSLRGRDSDTVPYRKSDGTYIWNLVNPDELALSWSCETTRNMEGSSDFKVVKLPTNGPTRAQLEAVREIETEDILVSEGVFGLNSEVNERKDKLMSEVLKLFPVCPACGEKLSLSGSDYWKIAGPYGLRVCESDQIVSLVDQGKPFIGATEGRDAQIVQQVIATGGIIEILAYEKWESWNLNLRFSNADSSDVQHDSHFPETIWEAVGYEEQTAKYAVELAKAVAELVGASNALQIFQGELDVPYGRARRQEAILRVMPGIAETDIGRSFLYLTRARDLDGWLAGAVAWLKLQAPAKAEAAMPAQPDNSPAGTGEFEETGNRHFKCGCGCQARLTKSEWREYKKGGEIKIECSMCGAHGTVKKQ